MGPQKPSHQPQPHQAKASYFGTIYSNSKLRGAKPLPPQIIELDTHLRPQKDQILGHLTFVQGAHEHTHFLGQVQVPTQSAPEVARGVLTTRRSRESQGQGQVGRKDEDFLQHGQTELGSEAELAQDLCAKSHSTELL